jgi:hypothetical protein
MPKQKPVTTPLFADPGQTTLASSLLPTSSWTAASPLSCRQIADPARRACSHERDTAAVLYGVRGEAHNRVRNAGAEETV